MLTVAPPSSFHPLIRTAALSLWDKLGAGALPASEAAITKMRALGDDEGERIWIELHAALAVMGKDARSWATRH
jgi:hypothetical protein